MRAQATKVRLVFLLAVLLLAAAGALVAAARGGASDTWASLRRPLHLPKLAAGAECPISKPDPRIQWRRINIFGGTGLGRGPVYPGLGASGGLLWATPDVQSGGPWFGEKVFWYVRPSYRGPVLIRARRIDGRGMLRFGSGELPSPELHLASLGSVSWEGQPPGSRGYPSGVRVLTKGCYAFQIDGANFSRVVVVTADLATYPPAAPQRKHLSRHALLAAR